MAWGLGLLAEGRRLLGLASIVIVASTVALAVAVDWPSIALVELVGVSAIASWLILMLVAVS